MAKAYLSQAYLSVVKTNMAILLRYIYTSYTLQLDKKMCGLVYLNLIYDTELQPLF